MHKLSLHGISHVPIRVTGIFVMIALLAVMGPLGAVQDLQHQVVSAGPDGHQHSDSDFCQWVQHHTGSSLTVAVPVPPCLFVGSWLVSPPLDLLFSFQLILSSPSRAPPRV